MARTRAKAVQVNETPNPAVVDIFPRVKSFSWRGSLVPRWESALWPEAARVWPSAPSLVAGALMSATGFGTGSTSNRSITTCPAQTERLAVLQAPAFFENGNEEVLAPN